MSRPFRRFLGSARYQAAAVSSRSGAQMGESFSNIGLDGSMMRVRVTTGPQFTASAPEALFALRDRAGLSILGRTFPSARGPHRRKPDKKPQ